MATHLKRLLGALLLAGVVLFSMASLRANGPSSVPPEPQSNGGSIPLPPQHRVPWSSPSSGVPDAFIRAAAVLFSQGMADPRGCEYREVSLAIGPETLTTRAFVLPARRGERRRFAVCWDGLVYPVLSVGKPGNLEADVIGKEESDGRNQLAARLWLMLRSEGRRQGPSHRNLDDVAVCLLLRLGQGRLATRLWCRLHPPGDSKREDDKLDPYLPLAHHWARGLLDQSLDAYTGGDDALALSGIRLLNRAVSRINAEARRRGFSTRDGEPLLDFWIPGPTFLADLERRTRQGPPEPIVCVGPGRHADPARRIAGQIARLDEVDIQQPYEGFRREFNSDQVVRALLREGEAAVEPLLACLEKDERLTRSIDSGDNRPISSDRLERAVPVHEVARDALLQILGQVGFESRLMRDQDRKRPPDRKALAKEMRTWLKQNRDVPVLERWFRVLADDRTSEEQWIRGMTLLIEEEPGPSKRLRGEPLRAHRDPTVSEVITRRIARSETAVAAPFGLWLAKWDAKAARPVLPKLMKRCLEAELFHLFLNLVEARLEIGDLQALDEYAAWVRTIKPQMVTDYSGAYDCRRMAEYADHPAVARAAEWLFNDRESPWVPLFRKTTDDFPTQKVLELVRHDMLRVAGFRRAVLALLADRTPAGKVTLEAGETFRLIIDGVADHSFRAPDESAIAGGSAKKDVRVCDYLAWLIAEHCEGAPGFEPWWPLEKRDRAVAECVEFVKRYHGSVKLPLLDRPATAELVEQGRAIFTLHGKGEVRTVRLPAHPLPACWVTLRDRRSREMWANSNTGTMVLRTEYDQQGHVWQAEEVFREGRWRRWYGFASGGRVARVPAEEIEFPVQDDGRNRWLPGPGQFDLCLDGPAGAATAEQDETVRMASGMPLTFRLSARNRSGLDQPAPAPEGVRLRVWYSPDRLSRQGMLVPVAKREPDWTELPGKPRAIWKTLPVPPSGPAQAQVIAEVDLQNWFDASRPGFYRVRLIVGQREATDAELHFSVAGREPQP